MHHYLLNELITSCFFRATHSELFPEESNGIDQSKVTVAANAPATIRKSGTAKVQPPKTTTPQLLYIQCKTKEHLVKDATASRKQLQEFYRAAYAQMTDEEKMPYIELAIKAQAQYTVREDLLHKIQLCLLFKKKNSVYKHGLYRLDFFYTVLKKSWIHPRFWKDC